MSENTTEFYGGIWWVPDGTQMRNATPGECATEIMRLRKLLNPPPRLCDIDFADAYHCRSATCRNTGTCTQATEAETNA